MNHNYHILIYLKLLHFRPRYLLEINHLLYGMNCERLKKIFDKSPIDLRTFLLLEENDMSRMGIDLPFERQRLKHGLRTFHKRGWKINAVAGLQARRGDSYRQVVRFISY